MYQGLRFPSVTMATTFEEIAQSAEAVEYTDCVSAER